MGALSFTATEDPRLEAAFAPRTRVDSAQWLGADGSTSVRLNASHHLWLFADTDWGRLVMVDGKLERKLEAMPHNTIALVRSSDDPPQPRFYARHTADGGVDLGGFFSPQQPDVFYWMVAGTMLPRSGALLALGQVMGGGGLGDFRGNGAVLLRNMTDEDPQRWPYTSSRIDPPSDHHWSWNEGLYASPTDGFVYFIGMHDPGHPLERTQHLARMEEASVLAFDWRAMRYWAGDALGWVANRTLSKTLYNGTYTGGTLFYHEQLRRFYVVGCQAYQTQVYVYTASSLTGEWETTLAYEIPQLLPPDVSYSAKSHPEYAADDEIVFTYNINGDQTHNLSIYHPKFIRLKIVSGTRA